METLGLNLIRTYVPLVIGAVISWLVAHGVNIDTQTSVAVSAAMTSVITAAYYTVVRVLEERWPSIGVLLGARRPAAVAAEEWPPQDDENQPWPPPEQTARHPIQPAAPQPPPAVRPAFTLSDLVAQTPPQPPKRRGPATGAIPMYWRPPGR